MRAERTCMGPLPAVAGSHFPGRPVPGERVLLIRHHGVIAHPGKEIVGLIVRAHVMQTEAPVLVFTVASLRRAMRAFVGTAGPLALRTIGRRAAILRRLDANTVEQR